MNFNGLNIPASTRGITGLEGVAYSPQFQNTGRPFIANINRAQAEALDPRLTRENWPWGGATFHIGEFPTAEQAAYARADFLANPKSYVDQWWNRGGRGAGRSLDFDFPDLTQLKSPARDIAIDAAYRVYRAGGTEAEIEAAGEKKRLENLAHVQRAQSRMSAEDKLQQMISNPNSPVSQSWKTIPRDERSDAHDYAVDKLQTGASEQDIAGIFQGWLNESALRNIRKLIRY